MTSDRKIWLYDTTLRDGSQREGIALSLEDKLKIAHQLDQMGIPFIEGGWPGANPKDVQFFWKLKEEPLQQAEVVAFCSTRRPHQNAAQERMLQSVLAAGTLWITLFGKSWDLHVTEGLQTNLSENLAMIKDTIEYFRSQGRRVIYDAEHWFDGYKNNPEYAITTLQAATEAGAEWLVLCDTNGGSLPHEISQIVKEVNQAIPQIQLGIHTHNDAGTAVANAIAAVRSGVTMVQGTINGYGERCGNANLCTLIPNLQIKLGYDCIEAEQLTQLTKTSRLVSEIVNLAPDDHAPFVGRSAFAHKAGVHVAAVEKNPLTYEHLQPELIGNQRRIVISDQSGLSNVLHYAEKFGIELAKQDPTCRQILEKLKTLENQGYQFEAAEASFELLMRSALGQRKEMFQLKGFQVHCEIHRDIDHFEGDALATIKVEVDGKDLLEVAEGNGPVSALDQAIRKALVKFYPEIAKFHLTDYKVRILDGTAGTAAKTRVLVESSNGQERWTTVGVSANILDASYQAVVEGIEYGLLLQSSLKTKVTTI
ncbi:2-isopropylmalate synthase/homocitrate synthase family protein [Stanieria cyanosphaera PCC 7437]|uniref:Citramalate synthase n=1 Tax=Stanieria cyanosphaera (strain ATCC 29371 / PCC 7437) TaxID=111780 RepID=K9XMI5_STAC7|nr:citramalate synthase [Stanieria cyanosphaera]AFZ33815.1 2-isopropylmalate synthase/homocitrate synthase family protein [Stanieria cyanosphaera PCC 7437]